MTLSLSDRQEIADLVSTYNHAIDHRDAEAWAGTFTADGELIVNGETRAQGRPELVEYVARRGATPAVRHWVNNLLISGRGETAQLRAYVMAFTIHDALGPPHVLGEYDDDLLRMQGGWKFRCRRLTIVAGRVASWASPDRTEAPGLR